MNEHVGHGAHCGGLCHLSERAQRRYWQLRRGGCPEHAEMLRTHGVWS